MQPKQSETCEQISRTEEYIEDHCHPDFERTSKLHNKEFHSKLANSANAPDYETERDPNHQKVMNNSYLNAKVNDFEIDYIIRKRANSPETMKLQAERPN